MLRAVIFDFNGVIADDETPHFLAFQHALAEEGLTLTQEGYYGTYLGMDERTCASALLAAAGRSDPVRLGRILERKAALFREEMAARKPPLFPGVAEFVKRAGRRYRLAIASGGRREQIDFALRDTPIEQDFAVIVSAEDTTVGKPDPAIYRLTLARLNASASPAEPVLRPDECLVIEDSLAGIESAFAAGMPAVAVATTYPADRLVRARLVLPRLDAAALDRVDALFFS